MVAAAYRAQAASCWDPVTGWRCSQTAGSDWESAAKVLDALTLAGAALIVGGFWLAVSGTFFEEKTTGGVTPNRPTTCLEADLRQGTFKIVPEDPPAGLHSSRPTCKLTHIGGSI